MRQLRICIGSNDGHKIAQTHMGDTEYFIIYDLTEGTQSVFIEQRNNAAKDLDHSQSDKMKQILNLVSDADILVAQQKSPNFVKIAQQTKYQPVIVKAESIVAVLELLKKHFEEIFILVEQRRKGDSVTSIPEFVL